MCEAINKQELEKFVEKNFEETVIPTLKTYIEIPNVSPGFDKDWETNGLQEQAVDLLVGWAKKQELLNSEIEIIKDKGRTPLVYMTVEGTNKDAPTILLYGHLDKQPPFDGWDEDKGPYKPVIIDDKLYGRGGADDGYAIFSSILAIKALQLQKIPHGRCVIIIEACEESGSVDLKYYIQKLKERIGEPTLVVCLDSGCANYDQLWVTTSLRGNLVANLNIKLINEGAHSGKASGIVSDTFRIGRMLLSRLEDEKTGKVLPKEFHVEIPEERMEQTKKCAEILKDEIFEEFPFVKGGKPMHEDHTELLLNKCWRPIITITGQDGIPESKIGGNVLRPSTTLKISMRLPPTLDANTTLEKMTQILTTDTPYGAEVTVTNASPNSGWNAPESKEWLKKSLSKASETYFGKDVGYQGEGGSIPFMGLLGKMFPKAQFCIAGLLGPMSNAHGPNEFLHIPYAKKLTCCVTSVIADHEKVKE